MQSRLTFITWLVFSISYEGKQTVGYLLITLNARRSIRPRQPPITRRWKSASQYVWYYVAVYTATSHGVCRLLGATSPLALLMPAAALAAAVRQRLLPARLSDIPTHPLKLGSALWSHCKMITKLSTKKGIGGQPAVDGKGDRIRNAEYDRFIKNGKSLGKTLCQLWPDWKAIACCDWMV